MPKAYDFIRNIFLVILPFCLLQNAWATHNRAGEISIEQVGDCNESLTVKATITTYTKASSRPADRDTLTICWGDGFCERVPRANGLGNPPKGVVLENDTKHNIYIAFHTFPARGTYIISMTDPNRNGGILNVNFPNSDQIKFHIQTTFTFPNPQFQGCNNTPVLLQPPIDIGCVGQTFTHNPNAYDADGDSLSYHFIVPLQDAGLVVPNYQFPDQISPGPDNQLRIDEVTGDIVWDAPQRAGEYNLAMIIVEYRQGIPIDTIIRDMQILIQECDNKPPEVETPFDEICVIAGDTVEFEVIGTAPLVEVNQKVRLTALGGPFEVPVSPAFFEPEDNRFLEQPVRKTFRWETACEHISDQFYSVVFKATDNFLDDTFGLATLKTVRIKVIGPPPEDVRATPGSGVVEVSWGKPYFCEDAAFDYFRGFTVWRRIGSNNFPPDTCNPGLAGRGYERLTPVPVRQMEDGRYVFFDEDVEQGRTYCYRILAQFARTTPGGRYTYNVVESLPSQEVCVQLNRDVPLITNVDVLQTGPSNGQIEVCWSKPNAEDLDTLVNPGPYRYEVLRATGITNNEADFQPIGVDFVSEYFATANDTCFVDTGLNTTENPYSYIINFYVNGSSTPLGATNPASSIFLSVTPTDRRNNLSWEGDVPWDNFAYIVFRQNDQGGFDSIATVSELSYADLGLVNGQEYCYRVRSIGSYGVSGIISPILNNSQVACAVPVDDVPPCPTVLTVENICDVPNASCTDGEQLVNTLHWRNPAELCEEGDDVAGYNIFFTSVEGGEFELVASIDNPSRTSFEHNPERGLAGCYAVTSFDGVGNESTFSNIVCADNCPHYALPNTFTPNGDGQNDLFIPFPFCFIERVEFKVFNRWGQLVFQTEDPNLNWEGTNGNGAELAEGVYYYVCRVFEQRVTGTEESTDVLSGYIELIRGSSE
jgi:gliding motility-associated-like protein